MASNSGRRSASSGDSRKRKSVYITGRVHDRALSELREDAERERDGASPRARGRGRVRGRARLVASARERPGPRERGKTESAARRAADARRDEREARHAGQQRALRLRIASVVLLLVAIVGSCVGVYRSSLFSVSHVEVEGTANLSAARVLALAKVPSDATLLRFPADQIAERVSKDPWVASVSVTRRFPDGMRIRIVERKPAAMVDAGTTFWLLDAGGMVIAQRSAEQTAAYVVVRDVPGLDPKPGRRTTSEPLLNALKVLSGLSATIVSQVKSVSAPTVDGTTLYTQDRVEIVVGQAVELKKKSDLVLTILSEQRGKVVSIDVRTTDRPTWRGLQD